MTKCAHFKLKTYFDFVDHGSHDKKAREEISI